LTSIIRKPVSFLIFILIFVYETGVASNFTLLELQQLSTNYNLHKTPQWHALLELKNGKPINSNRNYLSNPFDTKIELEETLKLIIENPHSACRYPARKRFIESSFLIPSRSLTPIECTEYSNFLNSVPNDGIYLVYASENVTSASSMMGHAMLRLDGKNKDGLDVKHGVTFFTELDTLNIPKLMFETLITGKEGIFKVAPYAPYQFHYREVEQRNIWEYELILSNYQRALIRDRIWELKYENPAYFFDKYNCATLTQLLISLAKPVESNLKDRIITPLDVVKYSVNNQLVKETRLIPSHKWKLHSLSDKIALKDRQKLNSQLESGTISTIIEEMSTKTFLALEYQDSLNSLRYSRGSLSEEVYKINRSRLEGNRTWSKHLALDVSSTISPHRKADESIVTLGLTRFKDEPFITLQYFPVANSLSNDNRHSFGETQLVLSDVKLRISKKSGDVFIDKFMLYDMVSRIPFELENPNPSSSFKVGLERVFDDVLSSQVLALTEGSIGVTKVFGSVLGFYTEIGLGVGTDLEKLNFYIEPRVGAYAYLANSLKLEVEYQHTYHYVDYNYLVRSVNSSLIHYISNKSQIQVKLKYINSGHHYFTEVATSFQHLF
jgi:hypothetical protein